MAEINTIIQLRNDSKTNWDTEAGKNTPLKPGEVAVEISEGKAKFKVGVSENSTFGNSPYVGSETREPIVGQTNILPSTSEVDDIDAILAVEGFGTPENNQSGDICIVRRYITGTEGAIAYTSYVFDKDLIDNEYCHGWVATDGNYSASNVFLKSDITLAGSFSSVGNYSKGDTINAGTSLESMLSSMLQQELYPNDSNISLPTAQITVGSGNGEVGSEYTVPTGTLEITSVGSYPYEPTATGINFPIGNVVLAEAESSPTTASNKTSNTTAMVKDNTITLKASGNKELYTDTGKIYYFCGEATYSDGAVPKTNLGNDYSSKQIKSAKISLSKVGGTFKGWRRIFGGGSTSQTIDSAAIRALSQLKKTTDSVPTTAGGKGIVFKAAKGATKVIFAYPASWTTKTPKFEIFTMAWGGTEGFEKTTVQVADYRGGTNGLKDYNVYTYTPATPLAADETQYCVYFS